MANHESGERCGSALQVLMASMLVRKIDADKGVPFPPES